MPITMRLWSNEQILNHIIFNTKKTFQNHAQEAFDMLAIDYSAVLCLVSS